MSSESYAARLASEQAIYNDCLDVHSLPPIFHYWSDRYVRPKLERFGFSSPDGMFQKHLLRHCATPGHDPKRFVSIGSGNCDLELRIGRHLLDNGYSNFSIECLDLNAAMLERGSVAASAAGLAGNMVFTEVDFNAWDPSHEYDAAMANQSLHHVVKLEELFARVSECLKAHGSFLISDIIGRNGHLRWPEALEIVQDLWRKLPPSYRFNQKLERYEELYQNWDCSQESFEGIRSQDVLPLLLNRFHFEVFAGFANLIDPFVDRAFGPNFQISKAWDREFIDAVEARDAQEIASGHIKPTHMVAVLGKDRAVPRQFLAGLPPEFCVRDSKASFASVGASGESRYLWGTWPLNTQEELEKTSDFLRRSAEQLAKQTTWAERLAQDCQDRTRWALKLEGQLERRTSWAQDLERELAGVKSEASRLTRELEQRTAWAWSLNKEVEERTAWALSLNAELALSRTRILALQTELEGRTAWALQLEKDRAELAAWALSLESQLRRRAGLRVRMEGAISEIRKAPVRAIGRLGRKLAQRCWRWMRSR